MPRQGFIDEFGIEINADNELAGTKCPVTPGRLRELYLGHRRDGVWHPPMSAAKIGEHIGNSGASVQVWLKKCGVVMRDSAKLLAKNTKTTEFRELLGELGQTDRMRQIAKANLLKGQEMSFCPEVRARAGRARSLRYSRMVDCNYCGESFKAKLSEIKYGRGKYCSKSCSRKGQRGRTSIDGLWCPQCLQESVYNGGVSHGKKQYICASCNRHTVNPLTEKPHPYDVEMRHEQLRAQGVELKPLPGKIKVTYQ